MPRWSTLGEAARGGQGPRVGTATERAIFESFQPTQPFLTIRDREGRQLSLPHQAFEHAYTLERVEHELTEAQRRIAEMEAQLRALREDGTSDESGDVSPP